MKLKLLFALLIVTITNAQTQIGQDIVGNIDGEQFGYHVCISADGTTIAGSTRPINGSYTAHVRIYKNISGVWTQIGNDFDIEAASGFAVSDVSLSADGSIVAIGQPTVFNNSMLGEGIVRIYENISGNWVQIGNDISGEAPNDESRIVSLSSDGSIVAIGGYFNSGNGLEAGYVRVYENISGVWTQIGQDIDGEAAGDHSGKSVSLSANGNIVAIGAIGNGSLSGHVRVYENISGVWTQIGQDIDGEAVLDYSGVSTSLSSDGSIVAIGAHHNDGNGSDSGHVRVYENISGVWTQIGQDIDGEAAGDHSGQSVSLASNGNIVAIGAPINDNYFGHVRIYKNILGTWTQVGNDIDGKSINGQCGWSVSLSANGNSLVISAPFSINNSNNSNDGQIRVYDLSGILSSDTFVLENFNIYPNPTTDILTIELKENLTLEKVFVYDTAGKLVKETTEKTINVSAFAKGMYNVQVVTNQGKATKKVIVK
ncbi:T9SS type A sorting domain-containing protein [Flavobacterium dauae]|uniref:T9SS type A sorting domain-containing protein n=1 Tax=Flavobacterium dauae TaxID=1563479 RepID=UPI00101B37E3|nr:T9SS type A sorting domain-containing protein [Flavobacterium dauae]WLD25104.1 T9SS type A sorting domain-containing protein [Flavobacterium dauae]